jgi:hypothetical protein
MRFLRFQNQISAGLAEYDQVDVRIRKKKGKF